MFGNVGTMITFRVGAADADFLEREFEPEFTPQDIVNLPNFRIYLKLMVDNVTSRPFSAKTIPPFILQDQKSVEVEKIIKTSRELYARPQAEVEREIQDWSSGISVSSGGGKHESVCSVCNKKIKVPFKPLPGRPVYCKTCLDKVKTGQIRPPTAEIEAAYTERGSASSLSELGIEFEREKKTPKPPQRQKPLPSQRSRKSFSSPKQSDQTGQKRW